MKPTFAGEDARVFYADTKFERKARSPGGLSRELALQNAGAEVKSLVPDFGAWIDQEIHRLNEALAAVASKACDATALEEARMACAQLRDAGGSMGYHLVTLIAKTLSLIIEANIEGAPYDQGVVDCHMAAFRLALTEKYRDLRADQVPELAAGLSRMSELKRGSSRDAHE